VAIIYVDGKTYEVDPSENLLHACLSQGLDIPYFCWHPAMGSVGACRQCAVKQYRDENDTTGRIVMSCMTPAADGTRISINDPEVAAFRASVIEWLMVNHPHDCPICDEGGECHLQDMTLMTGHSYRRFRFKKRTYHNQYLGPLINHEMNRCIQCYRCVRYYRDVAGGRDLDVFGAHDALYFGRHTDGILENEFSGNLVEVCPTGVFTDKTLKQHYTRKWDLQTAPSVCVSCSVGCNTIPGERYGSLRRIRNRYNREVNGYFLCDRGRYGYEFVNHEKRIYSALTRPAGDQAFEPVRGEQAVEAIRELFANGAKAIGIGSPRASLESNYALRELVGLDSFYAGISAQEHSLVQFALQILKAGPARTPSLHDIEQADAVFVLGEDLTNTAPMLAHAVRQMVLNRPMEIPRKLGIPDWNDYAVREAIQDEKSPILIATPAATKLDDVAIETYHAAPDDIARLGYAVSSLLEPVSATISGLPENVQNLAENMASTLKDAKHPVIISGTSSRSEAVMQAAASIAWSLRMLGIPAELSMVVPECNSLGLAMLGGQDLEKAMQALQTGQADTLIILENDLYHRAPASTVDALLNAAKHVIVLDHLETDTTRAAHIVLPAATFAEGDGTLVSQEGRAQRFIQVFIQPQGEVWESWRWLGAIQAESTQNGAGKWSNLDGIVEALAQALPEFAPIRAIAPDEKQRFVDQKIPRQSHRHSGRTAVVANLSVHEPKPPDDLDAPYTFSMEGYKGTLPGKLEPRYWAPNWNSVQALNKFQSEVNGPLMGGDPGVRLIEPQTSTTVSFFDNVPRAFEPSDGRWLVTPMYHIFGSEELSVLAHGISELVPSPYLALHPDDAASIQIQTGDRVVIRLNDEDLSLPVLLAPSLARGLVGLPVGLAGIPVLDLPAWTNIVKVKA
jgi:NADH-quinone oxidoreductase subunit G